VRDFEALTEEEEKVGLYLNTAIIGFRANWEQLLRECGVEIEGHTLKQVAPGRPLAPHSIHRPAVVHRHKTAITRYDLSKPVKTLLEYGQLRNGVSFFDYGCGLGADVRGLKELGYQAAGWDPVHAPNEERTPSEVVNLGYVLNVIENPAERLETLVRAWGLTRRLLVVSALLYASKNTQDGLAFQDGILTTRRTFQKYFTQAELQQYVEDALDVTAVPASLGVFYVFKEATDQQGFLQSRSRRVVDWDSLGLRWERPQKKERTPRVPLLPQRAQARPLHEEPHSHRHRGLLLLPRVP
jgi:DNA phosphorothioation-associated putative methyltransferase